MIRFDSHGQRSELTPCGREPGTPLPGRHEIVANALVRGMTNHEAGIEAGYKSGPGLAGNISRLRHTPKMRERMAEIAAIAEEDARIENRWLVQDLHLFRKASLAHFWKRDIRGNLVLRSGKPVIDFSHATEEQLRTLSSLTVDRGKVKLEVHKPMEAIDKLARHRGLYDDKKMDLMVNNTLMSVDLSKLTDEQLNVLETVFGNQVINGDITRIERHIVRSTNGACERIAEKIEKIAQAQEPAAEFGDGATGRNDDQIDVKNEP
jgi:hypothetical protein